MDIVAKLNAGADKLLKDADDLQQLVAKFKKSVDVCDELIKANPRAKSSELQRLNAEYARTKKLDVLYKQRLAAWNAQHTKLLKLKAEAEAGAGQLPEPVAMDELVKMFVDLNTALSTLKSL